MRNVINKGLTVEDIIGGATLAFKGGWNKVKFYFMLGLPTETDEDMKAIVTDRIRLMESGEATFIDGEKGFAQIRLHYGL